LRLGKEKKGREPCTYHVLVLPQIIKEGLAEGEDGFVDGGLREGGREGGREGDERSGFGKKEERNLPEHDWR